MIEMGNRLISVSTLFFIIYAAKVKQRKSFAPHLYLATAINPNATKVEREKSHATC